MRRGGVGAAVLLALGVMLTIARAALAENEPPQTPTAPSAPTVRALTLDGAIGPALADYLIREIKDTPETGATALVIRMDTPGGLVTSMRVIVQAILAAKVPVIVYVTPQGAHAASAGTYILYASHVAAMAPGTNLGAATPIEMGGAPGEGEKKDAPPELPPKEGDKPTGDSKPLPSKQAPAPKAPPGAADMKAVNDLVALIRSLAELRGRNAEWGERAVREAETLSANAALEANVVEYVADSLPALLDAVDGRVVKLTEGREVTLKTKNATIVEAEMSWATKVLLIITDPNIAFILMTLGMYGLIFELSNPGSVLPGVLGIICLLVGLYAVSVLPVTAVGLALLGVGVLMMLGEAFTPGVGVLGVGGLISFALGATFLFDSDMPEFRLAWPVIIGTTAATGVFILVVVLFALGAQRRRITTGREDLIGATAVVLDWRDQEGHVRVEGERWRAQSSDTFVAGDSVTVVAIDGLVLSVARADSKASRRAQRR